MRRVLKWAVRVVAGVALLAALAFGILYFRAASKMSAKYEVAVGLVAIPAGDAAALAEGRRLATVYCSHCHHDDFGGGKFIDDGLAKIDALNLTPGKGSATAGYSDADWVRAIRHGVKKDGRSVIIMPSDAFARLSDEDLGAIVAFLKSAPPVDRSSMARDLRPLGTVLVGAGMFDSEFHGARIDHAAPRPAPPVKTVSVSFGEYLVKSFGCYHCHGSDMGGQAAPSPADPYVPNLTQGGSLRAFSEDSFVAMVRGRSGPHMPWTSVKAMNDDELRSIWRYLLTLPPVARETPPVKAAKA
jgi:mono/diheme cytochrome c family protein